MKQHAAAHIQNGTGEVYKNDLIIIGSQGLAHATGVHG